MIPILKHFLQDDLAAFGDLNPADEALIDKDLDD